MRAQEFQKRAQEAPKALSRPVLHPNPRFYQKYTFYLCKMKVFEGARVRLGVRNRHREVPRQGKQRFGRRRRNKSSKNP
mgnify:CR=1 FL=1